MMKRKLALITLLALLVLPMILGGQAVARGPQPVNSGIIRFLVTADLHYARWGSIQEKLLNEYLVKQIGSKSSPYRGLVIAGDLIWGGDERKRGADYSWGHYKDHIDQDEDLVYDGWGNHDLEANGNPGHPKLWQEMLDYIGRYRQGLVNRSPANGYYSWDWDAVHFVQLGNDPNLPASLDFLRDDLRTYVGTSGRPVVLIHHLPADAPGEYGEVIRDYNVIAIFVGHRHCGSKNWELQFWQGIPRFIAGPATDFHTKGCPKEDGGFFIEVEISDISTIQGCTRVWVTKYQYQEKAGTIKPVAPTRVVRVPDRTPPITSAELSGTLGENGWYISPV